MSTDAAPVITVDGPSGTGKGTLGLKLARALGWHFLDSGAVYRALALRVMALEMPVEDESPIAALAGRLVVCFHDQGGAGIRVFCEGTDTSDAIRGEDCARVASRVAVLPAVRAALLALQRGYCRPPGLIADGRDMGTVVFPAAPLKLYLAASAEARAQRRYKQLKQQGIDVTLPQLIQDIAERDARDRGRRAAPLMPAGDAVVIDTTEWDASAVFERVKQLVRERGLAGRD
ncbi:MAG: (d)CMP kinase [Gammaproteobacteria bacterium]